MWIDYIDLHGNSNKQETSPDGSKDENVFDIQQGVSINILVKTGKKKSGELGKVYHFDLYGIREDKYDFLTETSLEDIDFSEIPNHAPNYFMVKRDSKVENIYLNGFNVEKLFVVNSVGIVTARDSFTLHETENEVIETIESFINLEDEEARKKFHLGKDVRDWKVSYARKDIENNYKNGKGKIIKISYRPFEDKWTFYTGKSKGFHCYPRNEVMKHMLHQSNTGFITARSNKSESCDHFFITDKPIETKCGERTTQSALFPLYLYHEEDNQTELLGAQETPSRTPNFDPEIVSAIAKAIGLTFTNEKSDEAGTFAPIDTLDYIYAVLHSPTYRETYKEFLKIDFPRVPYPSDADTFWQLVALGGELRQIHLLESPKLAAQIKALSLGYPIGGDNSVTRKMTKTSVGFEPDEADTSIGKVWLNNTQYFTNVPLVAWEFYIGGYQPAQKWLKDRREHTLDHHDIKHYLNIIASLSLTNELMQQIDNIDVVG